MKLTKRRGVRISLLILSRHITLPAGIASAPAYFDILTQKTAVFNGWGAFRNAARMPSAGTARIPPARAHLPIV